MSHISLFRLLRFTGKKQGVKHVATYQFGLKIIKFEHILNVIFFKNAYMCSMSH